MLTEFDLNARSGHHGRTAAPKGVAMFLRRSLLVGLLALVLVGCSDAGGTDWYRDADADGWGTAAMTLRAVAQPAGYVAIAGDCDDGDATVYPGAPEILDGIDNDCNGIIDDVLTIWYRDADGDGYGDDDVTLEAIDQPAGYTAVPGDCNDDDAAIYPGAPEILDGIDNDCNGLVDDIADSGGAISVGAACRPERAILAA